MKSVSRQRRPSYQLHKAGLQPARFGHAESQGVALGWYESGLWPVFPRSNPDFRF